MPDVSCVLRIADPSVSGYRIYLPEGQGDLIYPEATFEIRNHAKDVLVIPYRHSRLQHLNVIVLDHEEKYVSRGWYGNAFIKIPTPPIREFSIESGEAFSATVVLLSTADQTACRAGKHLAYAEYACDVFEIQSETVEFDVLPYTTRTTR